MKGIVIAGRLWNPHYPITKAVPKQLLPLYDKPMIYYPISIFDACRNQGNPNHFNSKRHPMYKDLLGDGSSLGIKFEYEIRENQNGLGEAFIIVEDFIGDGNVALILKDHIPEAQVHGNP